MKWLGKAAELLLSLGLNGASAVAHRNRLINGNLSINQRGAPTASTAYTAYVFDRWRAGAGGVTLSWAAAANGDVTATITAGSLVQVIEGALYLPEGGTYTLSWAGTAKARVYQGAAGGTYVASPLVVNGLTAGALTTVEFSTGTLGLVQFEPGPGASAFERRDDEMDRCLRYFRRLTQPPLTGVFGGIGGTGGNGAARMRMPLVPPMRIAPGPSMSGNLPLYNGIAATTASAIANGYSTASVVDLDLTMTSTANYTAGQTVAVYMTGAAYLDLFAEL